jgi:DNA-binding transcriptional regulator GbsR (MarR family)
MNLRELMSWGVVRKLHRAGERRELYRAETDVWTLFQRILKERKRRELDPTLMVLERIHKHSEIDPSLHDLRLRVESLRHFFVLIEGLSARLLSLDSQDMAELGEYLAGNDRHSSMPGTTRERS